MSWAVCYKRAIDEDGKLLYPKKLSHEFLGKQLKTLGSFFFANQYQNEIVPEGEKPFQDSWIRHYEPHQIADRKLHTIAFLDPASSLEEGADFTALVVVDVDTDRNWWVKYARMARLTPTQQAELVFRANAIFKPIVFGIEAQGYQVALQHMIVDRCRKERLQMLPIHPVVRGPEKTKEMRILSLVPRYEWDWIRHVQGLRDLEMQLAQFPRGKFVDLIDALASIEDVAIYPTPERTAKRDPAPNSPEYEKWFISQRFKRASGNSGRPGR